MGRDIQSATIPTGTSEFKVYVYSSGYAVEFSFSINAPTKTYYTGSNTSGYVGASIVWNYEQRKLSSPVINVSGQQSTGAMMVVYR